jgi:hypothetical protein
MCRTVRVYGSPNLVPPGAAEKLASLGANRSDVMGVLCAPPINISRTEAKVLLEGLAGPLAIGRTFVDVRSVESVVINIFGELVPAKQDPDDLTVRECVGRLYMGTKYDTVRHNASP